jgi:hypothetical protein
MCSRPTDPGARNTRVVAGSDTLVGAGARPRDYIRGTVAWVMARFDHLAYWFARMLRGGEILAPGDPLSPIQFIDARMVRAPLDCSMSRKPQCAYRVANLLPLAITGGVPIVTCSILQLAPNDLFSGTLAVNECLISPGVIPSPVSAAVMNAQIIQKAMNRPKRRCSIRVVDDVSVLIHRGCA